MSSDADTGESILTPGASTAPGAQAMEAGDAGAPGELFIVSAPSGAGKTTMVRALVEHDADIVLSISYTTRKQRPGEQPDVDYHFVSASEFERLAASEALLEHAQVFDHWYGTSRPDVLRELAAGRDVVLEIDWQGARQARARMPEGISVFVMPPTRGTLESRLRARAKDTDAIIARRLRDAVSDMTHYDEFDYLIFNANLNDAVAGLRAIVQARRLAATATGRPPPADHCRADEV